MAIVCCKYMQGLMNVGIIVSEKWWQTPGMTKATKSTEHEIGNGQTMGMQL